MESGPAYFMVGAEVSAKFKGAYCEAVVIKVEKLLKYKVIFKSGGLSTILTSDAISKGELKVGAKVKACHPYKNLHKTAIILKIQDCSQYTVNFLDGDIRVLKRINVLERSSPHFRPSESLTNLPLNNPEKGGQRKKMKQ